MFDINYEHFSSYISNVPAYNTLTVKLGNTILRKHNDSVDILFWTMVSIRLCWGDYQHRPFKYKARVPHNNNIVHAQRGGKNRKYLCTQCSTKLPYYARTHARTHNTIIHNTRRRNNIVICFTTLLVATNIIIIRRGCFLSF